MNQVQNYNVNALSRGNTRGVSETELEHTIGIHLLADYNEQLAQVAHTLKENLEAKHDIHEDLIGLQTIATHETTDFAGETYFNISQAECANLQTTHPELNIVEDNGNYYVGQESLEASIQIKQEELAGLNSTSETMALTVQSLVDQRKQAINLLSNLMAVRGENLMGIIRNLKS